MSGWAERGRGNQAPGAHGVQDHDIANRGIFSGDSHARALSVLLTPAAPCSAGRGLKVSGLVRKRPNVRFNNTNNPYRKMTKGNMTS